MKLDEKERAEFMQLFLKTVRTWVNNLRESLSDLKNNPHSADAIEKGLIAAHSLKSDAGMMDYEHVATLAHVIEDIFFELKKGNLKLSSELIDELNSCCGQLSAVIDKIKTSQSNPEINTEQFIIRLKTLTGVQTVGFGKSSHK